MAKIIILSQNNAFYNKMNQIESKMCLKQLNLDVFDVIFSMELIVNQPKKVLK